MKRFLSPVALLAIVWSVIQLYWAFFGMLHVFTSRPLHLSFALGIVFLAAQLYDYTQLHFRADDTIYGTTFYTLTGFHGAHVAGGALFIAVVTVRALGGQFTAENHEAVEASSMYWHFVDVVWIALFTVLYIIK